MKAIDYKGEVIHTRGQLGHTGSQGRYDGFQQVVSKYPEVERGRRDPGRMAGGHHRQPLAGPAAALPGRGRRLFPRGRHGAGGRQIVEAPGMADQVKLVGVDGLKNACEAILEGRFSLRSSTRAAASTVARSGLDT